MNILFHLRSIAVGIGGVEVVTINLANKFYQEGHNVIIFALYKGNSNVTDRLHPNVKLYIGEGNVYSEKNVRLLRKVLIDDRIDIAINQMGLPVTPIRVLKDASKGMSVKIISFYHNAPSWNGRLASIDRKIEVSSNHLNTLVLKFLRFLWKKITSISMRYVYSNSDAYMLLSNGHVNEFVQFTGIKSPRKIRVQTNPITIRNCDFNYKEVIKDKTVLYVGRLDYSQKRVDRVINVWSQIEDRFPDWNLVIVGDGTERDNLERMVKDMHLQRVSFEGFQHPKPYYERASILLLTSEFEGWGLVLPECMSFGVVPIVYGSYSAVYDIIDNGKNGLVLPYDKSGFKAEQMARLLETVMKDKEVRNKMAMEAMQKSKEYSLDMIYQQWMEVLNALSTI